MMLGHQICRRRDRTTGPTFVSSLCLDNQVVSCSGPNTRPVSPGSNAATSSTVPDEVRGGPSQADGLRPRGSRGSTRAGNTTDTTTDHSVASRPRCRYLRIGMAAGKRSASDRSRTSA